MGETTWRTFRSPKWLVPSLPCVGEVNCAMCCVKMSRGLKSAHEQRADIANHGRDPVARLQSVGGADRNGFLAEAGINSADNLVLAEESDEPLLERRLSCMK